MIAILCINNDRLNNNDNCNKHNNDNDNDDNNNGIANKHDTNDNISSIDKLNWEKSVAPKRVSENG